MADMTQKLSGLFNFLDVWRERGGETKAESPFIARPTPPTSAQARDLSGLERWKFWFSRAPSAGSGTMGTWRAALPAQPG